MLEIGESDLCVVCNKPGLTFYNQKSGKEHCKKSILDASKVSGKAPVSTTDQETALLLPQLRRVFLLQQIFKHCVQDDTTLLEALLQELGDPCDWFEICEGCTELIDSGIDVLRKLRRFQEEHKRLVGKLEKKLSESYCGQPWKLGSRCILVRNEGEEKSRKRLDFRNKIRKIGSPPLSSDLDLHLKPAVENVTENADDLTSCDIDFDNPSIPATPDDSTKNTNDKDRTNANDQQTLTRLRPRLAKKRKFVQKDSDSEEDFDASNNDGEPQDPDFSVSDDGEGDEAHELESEPVEKEKPVRAGEINKKRKKKRTTRFCEICKKTLKMTSLQFKLHMFKLHNQGEPDEKFTKCPECGQLFASKAPLEYHIARKHPAETEGEEAKFFCEKCGKGFRLELSLKAHLYGVHERKQAKTRPSESKICRVCGVELKNSVTHWFHIRDIHGETLKMTEAEVDEYVKRQNEKKPFRCKQCPERFAFGVLLYHHKRNAHREIRENHRCEICGKGFFRPYLLNIHKEAYHTESKSSYRCEDCGRVYITNSRLKQHRSQACVLGKGRLRRRRKLETNNAASSAANETPSKSHHRAQSIHEALSKGVGEDGTPSEEIANEDLLKAPPKTSKHTLELHDSESDQDSGPSKNDDEQEDSNFSQRKKRGGNPKRFCEFCNKTLKCDLVQFKFHLYKSHNQGEPDEKFPMCSECGELFSSKAKLAYHMSMQHPEKTENAGEDKFFCEICGKGFRVKVRLTAHMKVVHHEEPAICQVCGMQFKNQILLKSHIRRMHPEARMSASEVEEYVKNLKDRFKCDICGNEFSCKAMVMDHMEAFHTDFEVNCEDCGKTFKSKLRLANHRRANCRVINQKRLLTSSQN